MQCKILSEFVTRQLRIISTPLNCLFVKVAIYCRVSSAENKPNLEYQAERLLNYCFFKGSSVVRVVKEVGSGVNDNRRLVVKLLQENDYDLIG